MVHVPDDERHAEVENKDAESLIESMKARISALEVLVGMLLSKNDDDSETPVEDLEDRISALEEKADSSASSSTITYIQTSARKDKHPFDIICEQGEGTTPKMSVFAPEGCVVVDGKNATITGADEDGYVEITDLDHEEEAVASVYCHVAKSEDEERWEATFDCVENSDAKYTFKIRTFGAYNGDGKSFTMADSVVSISTGAVDDKSTDKNSDDKIEIFGWKTKDHESQTLAQKMGSGAEASEEVVVRSEKNGELRYVKIGNIPDCSITLDKKSVDNNTAGAVEIKGWNAQESETTTLATKLGGSTTSTEAVVVRSAVDGNLSYVPIGNLPDNSVTLDNVSTVKTDGAVEINGWKKTANDQNNSVASLISAESESNYAAVVRVGGPNGSLSYLPIGSLSKKLKGTVQVSADIRYNIEDHRLEKRIDTVNLATGMVVEGQYEMITNGQAVAYSSVFTDEIGD